MVQLPQLRGFFQQVKKCKPTNLGNRRTTKKQDTSINKSKINLLRNCLQLQIQNFEQVIVARTIGIGVIVIRTIELNPSLNPNLLPNLLRTEFEILNYFANEQTKHQFFDSCLLKICPGVFTL